MAIKVLARNVVNQISAGEVVEKPASIVKELVENSIDAGASVISIEIEKGGIDRVCVTDNGTGINKDEVMLAFTPHATSKLEKIDDLDSLVTMGFRGEALATISAVSKVTLITKTDKDDVGIRVNLIGGQEEDRSEVATVTGTKIDVRELFFNTPARLKFLRKPKSEENDITNYVEKLILSHSNISFKYIVDGKLIYNTVNCGIIDNIYTIYGADVANNVLEVNYSIGEYSITGFISKPEYAKSNRTYQNLFVNNRFCNNLLVSTAVGNAYENFLMKGKFPLYVLFLNLPQNEIDVNVHPNKLEVKFVNTSKIFKLCSDGVYKALYDFNHIKNIEPESEYEKEVQMPKVEYANITPSEGVSYKREENKSKEEYKTEDYITDEELKGIDRDNVLDKSYSEYFKNKNTGSYGFELTENILLPEINLNNDDPMKDLGKIETIDVQNNKTKTEQTDYKSLFDLDYRVVGKVFNTYLVLEQEDKMYFIDQHAAHERQRYDKLMEELDSNMLQTQSLLIPYTFNVSFAESSFITENLEILNSFGIEICEYGNNCFKIYSVPLVLADMDLKNFIEQLLINTTGFAKSPKEIIKEKFMQIACKSAVKGGDDLKDMEIKSLLNDLKNSTKVLLCPHGRPIIVEVSKNQIEKWFKRIV